MPVPNYDARAFVRELQREHAGSGRLDYNTVLRAISRVIPFLDPGDRRVWDDRSQAWRSIHKRPGEILEPVDAAELRAHIKMILRNPGIRTKMASRKIAANG